MPPSKSRKIMSLCNSSMEDLPVEVMVNILSRLPSKTIIHCKCVCKKWLNIVLDSYFADIQLSRSPAGIMFCNKLDYLRPGILKWVEVEDELDHHHLHHDPVMSLDLNHTPIFQRSDTHMVGSVNGLICVWQYYPDPDKTYICNPITREYMILPSQENCKEEEDFCVTGVIGFGVGLVTKEYKVVRILQGYHIHPNARRSILKAEVYTLGSGEWRNLGHVPYSFSGCMGPFLNGHVHWFVADLYTLCAFNFDTETFKSFPSPPSEDIEESQVNFRSLGVLKGCLCREILAQRAGD